jgi:hypothetical protein
MEVSLGAATADDEEACVKPHRLVDVDIGFDMGGNPEPVVLLCFEFGSDKMEHWPKIYPNIAKQATHLRQPDGQFIATGKKSL